MQRHECAKRPNWVSIIEEQGLNYWKTIVPADGSVRSYWGEGSYYSFTMAQIEQMEKDSAMLFDMFDQAGDYLIERPNLMEKMGIPRWTHEQIIESWNRYDRVNNDKNWGSVYGRTDVHFDPATGRIKLYEFNADTPTSLLEAALVQWTWKEQVKPEGDQWNGMYEMLIEAFRRNLAYAEKEIGHKPVVYFMCTWEDNLLSDLRHLDKNPNADHSQDCYEDIQNTRVLMEACKAAGYEVELRYVQEIELREDGRFYDSRHPGPDKPHLDVVFKLYPWEFLINEEFGQPIFKDALNIGKRSEDDTEYLGRTLWIEPPYKMLWSNKGILPVLWQLFKDDPVRSQLLIPSYFEGEEPASFTKFIRKPIFGREGASMTIVLEGETIQKTDGDYGEEGFILQEFCPPPVFMANGKPMSATIGIWYIDGEPAGMGIRESDGPIADNLSYYIPHIIKD